MTDELLIRLSGGGLGIPGLAIQAFTRSRLSHVELVLPNGEGLLGALPWHGVCIRPEPVGKDRERVVKLYRVRGGRKYQDEVIRLARSQLGKPYDWMGVIGFALHRDWEERSHWFCSEFIIWLWDRVGHPLLHDDRPSHISPRDVDLSTELIAVA